MNADATRPKHSVWPNTSGVSIPISRTLPTPPRVIVSPSLMCVTVAGCAWAGAATLVCGRGAILPLPIQTGEPEVTDDEVKDLVREQAEAAGEDPDAIIEQLWQTGRHERLRADLRLKKALDKIVEDVKPIPVELARARESIWTPEKEKPETAAKLWTPGSSKEPA